MAKKDTEDLRKCALERLAAMGCSFTRIHQRKLHYRFDDGQTFALATNMDRVLICRTGAPDSTARLDFEDTDYILFAIPQEPRGRGAIDVYLLPSAKVAELARRDHEQFLKVANTRGGNMTWQQRFDDREGKPSSGYAVLYATHKLS